MKQIIFMCNAMTRKAKEFEPYLTPSLNEEGINEINEIKNSASDLLKEIEFIQCSDSKPSRETFQALYQCFDKNVKFMFDNSMETNFSRMFIEKLQWTPSIYEKIMFIGNKNYFEEILKKIRNFKIPEEILTSEIIILQSKEKSWQKVKEENIEIVKRIVKKIEMNVTMNKELINE